MSILPTIDEERLGVLRARLRSWKTSGLIDPGGERILSERTRTRWSHSAVISRAIYFVLTLVCVAAVYGLAGLAGLPEEVLTALLCLTAAEVLILRFGLFRAGPDEALYLAGLFLLILALPGPPKDEGILLFMAALLVAGVRLRNGLFLTASAVAAIAYIVAKTDHPEVGAFIGLGVAFAAVALLNREWTHPVWDRSFSWTVLVMPVLAYALVTVDDPVSRVYVIIAGSIVATLLILAGVSIRNHAPLLSGLLVMGLTGYEAGRRIALPIETRLMLAGALLGIVVFTLHRYLRGKPSGVTAAELLASPELKLLEPAAAAVLGGSQPRSTSPSEMQHGGGSYGGGGASGEF